MAQMDVKIGLSPAGPYRLRGGNFERRMLIARSDRPASGGTIIPVNGLLVETGLFKVISGPQLAMTAECVHYFLGNKPELGKLTRSEIDEKLKGLSGEEKIFLAAIIGKIECVYAEVFAHEERIRTMEHLSAGKEILARQMELEVVLPRPTQKHIEYLVERTAELLKGKILLVNQVLRELNFDLG